MSQIPVEAVHETYMWHHIIRVEIQYLDLINSLVPHLSNYELNFMVMLQLLRPVSRTCRVFSRFFPWSPSVLSRFSFKEKYTENVLSCLSDRKVRRFANAWKTISPTRIFLWWDHAVSAKLSTLSFDVNYTMTSQTLLWRHRKSTPIWREENEKERCLLLFCCFQEGE